MTRRLLPPIGVPIPPAWDTAAEAEWAELRSESSRLRGDALLGASGYEAVERLRGLLLAGEHDAVREAVRSPSDAGALAWLWCESDGSCRDTISVAFLEAIRTHHSRPPRLVVECLEAVYFDRFDRLDELGDQAAASIRCVIAEILRKGWGSSDRYAADHITTLLADDAPRLVATAIRSNGSPMHRGLQDWQLDAYQGGRFVELVRQFGFLDELRALPIGEGGRAIDELRLPETFDAPHVRGQLVGHAALGILIGRAEIFPGELWRDLVLEIAGDPRLDYSDQYRRWWPTLGADAEARVMSWLARADLTVFLELLTQYASDDPAMKRMLAKRRTMLEGLLNEGIVRRSRLFLGQDVRLFVGRLGTANRIWDSALLQGKQQSEKALLYLDCGAFHIIEGSHNTKLWVYLSQPGMRLVSAKERVFYYSDLTSGLAESYEARRRRDLGEAYTGIWHRGIAHQGMWQRPFLEFLGDNGIFVNPEAILESRDYRDYRSRFGLVPITRKRPERQNWA